MQMTSELHEGVSTNQKIVDLITIHLLHVVIQTGAVVVLTTLLEYRTNFTMLNQEF